jgi:hypothetical protein
VEVTRRICLYGNSVILGTLGVSLRRYPELEVTSLWPDPIKVSELQALNPDVIIFDLDAPRPEAAFSLLESCPGLLLIGVSPDTNYVRTWHGQQLRELPSTKDLVEVINKQLERTT